MPFTWLEALVFDMMSLILSPCN